MANLQNTAVAYAVFAAVCCCLGDELSHTLPSPPGSTSSKNTGATSISTASSRSSTTSTSTSNTSSSTSTQAPFGTTNGHTNLTTSSSTTNISSSTSNSTSSSTSTSTSSSSSSSSTYSSTYSTSSSSTPEPTEQRHRDCLTSDATLVLADGEVVKGVHATFGAQVFASSDAATLIVLPKHLKDGCDPFEYSMKGEVSVLKRGGCDFYTKALNAQQGGARALVIYNNKNESMLAMEPLECSIKEDGGCTDITIPVIMVQDYVGTAIKKANWRQKFGFTRNEAIKTNITDGTPLTYGQLLLHVQLSASTPVDRAVGDMDVSQITTLAQVFRGAATFNTDLSQWPTQQVVSMSATFYDAVTFNSGISEWQTSSVTDMGFMFHGATEFNQAIGHWNTSSVDYMNGLFSHASSFNQDISGWNVHTVTHGANPNANPMHSMFTGADSLYHDLTHWDVTFDHDGDLTDYRTAAPASVWNAATIAVPDEAEAPHAAANTYVVYADTSYDVDVPANYMPANQSSLLRGFASTTYAVQKFDVVVEPRISNLVSVDKHHGSWVISPDARHVGLAFTTQLKAFDATGAGAPLTRRWAFHVMQRPAFSTTEAWKHTAALSYPTKYQVNETYTLAAPPMERAQLFQGFADGEADAITYAIVFSQANASNVTLNFFTRHDGKTLVEPSTRAEIGAYHGVLQATDKAGKTAEVYSWDFEILAADTDTPAYGPGNRSCANGASSVDAVLMDQGFECDCTGTNYTGNNCQTPKPATDTPAPINGADEDSTAIIAIASVAALLGTLLLAGTLLTVRSRYVAYRKANAPTDFNTQLQLLKDMGLIDDEADSITDRVPRELKRAWLTQVAVLGSGQFGQVWKGLLNDQQSKTTPEYLVAAKVVKRQDTATNYGSIEDGEGSLAAEDALLKEALIMAQVETHPNLVSLFGVITTGTPKVLVISYCEHGELRTNLVRQAANGSPFALPTKLRFCSEIADGMRHLASHNLVHRDLATRNVLLDSGNMCKIADFGMSRRVLTDDNMGDYYRGSGNNLIPVRWTAPEGLRDNKFSSASDVWSFGITCVEVFQDGQHPYPATKSNPVVITMVTSGQVHPCPSGCDAQLYAVLLSCWNAEPVQRPSFNVLREQFQGLLKLRVSGADNSTNKYDTGNGVLLHPSIAPNEYARLCGLEPLDATHHTDQEHHPLSTRESGGYLAVFQDDAGPERLLTLPPLNNVHSVHDFSSSASIEHFRTKSNEPKDYGTHYPSILPTEYLPMGKMNECIITYEKGPTVEDHDNAVRAGRAAMEAAATFVHSGSSGDCVSIQSAGSSCSGHTITEIPSSMCADGASPHRVRCSSSGSFDTSIAMLSGLDGAVRWS